MTIADAQLIGREDLLRQLRERIESDASVVTVVGPPGVGKSAVTRQALKSADVTATAVCDVGAISEPGDFVAALGRTLRVESEGDLFEAVAAMLRRRNPVLLLDGFDQLVEHKRDTLVRLADAVPGVLFVVTSRERLAIAGEETIVVPPLEPNDAVRLFTGAGNVPADDPDVPRLVDLLDCNPLAIELAASRLSTFTPTDLLERLDRRFKVLRSRSGGSLEEAIALSWELLNASERSCLAQTTVFRGGFDLDAAEAVLEVADEWVLDVIESLVEKSLLERNARGRLRLSQSIRAFIEEHADEEPPRRRHAVYFGTFADRWSHHTWTAADGDRAVDEIPNLTAVLDRFEQSEPELAVRAALGLHALLRYRGMTPTHSDVLSRGVAAARRIEDSESIARLLQARGELGVVRGQLREAERDCREAIELTEEHLVLVRSHVHCAEAERRTGRAAAARDRLLALTRTPRHERFIDAHIASCHVELGELDEARQLLMRIAPPAADADDVDEYLALKRLAYAHYYLGNYEQQHRLNEEALELAERVGDRRRVARARQGLGDAAFARGDFAAARKAYETALDQHRELGNEHLTGVLLGNLGGAEHRSDRFDPAAQHYHEALRMHRRAGATPYEAVVNFALGVLEHERGHLDDASFHYGRAVELFADLDKADDIAATTICQAWLEAERGDEAAAARRLNAVTQPGWDAVVERTRARITGSSWDDVEITGQALPERLAQALGDVLRGRPPRGGELSQSLQGRLLLRWLGQREVPVATIATRADLLVGRDGEWFQSTGEVVNLRRRKAHRRILDDLARRREQNDPPLDVYDAFDLGWPGELAEPELAAERVYWVVGVLRRLGLDGILLTSDEGYYLNPSTTVERADEPPS